MFYSYLIRKKPDSRLPGLVLTGVDESTPPMFGSLLLHTQNLEEVTDRFV